MPRGQRRRQLLEAVDPGHLLDQVGFTGDVVAAERRRLDVKAVVRVGRHELERFKDAPAALARDRRPKQTRDPRVPEPDRPRLRARAADVDRPGYGPGAAQFDHQLRRHCLRLHCLLRLKLLLEPCRCLAAQPELERGPMDVRPDPVRDLHQHPASCRVRLPSGCHPSRRRSTSGLRRPRSAPSRGRASASGRRASQSFPRRSARRTVSSAPGDTVQVERVQRLSGKQHHVVRDVDDVGDRPLTGGHQTRLEPRRRRPDLHVLEHAGGETRAELRALDADLALADLAAGMRVLGPRRRAQRRLGRGVHLPGDAVDARGSPGGSESPPAPARRSRSAGPVRAGSQAPTRCR